jgi:hypothetical protein
MITRKSFLATLLGLLAAPLAWAMPWKKKGSIYDQFDPTGGVSFTHEDVGSWLKRCGGCGDFYPDLQREVMSNWVTSPGFEAVAYSHGNRVCIVQESKLTNGWYTIGPVQKGEFIKDGTYTISTAG